MRRFIRDFVDSRFSFIELMIPLLIVTMIMGYSGNARSGRDRQHDPDGHDPPRRPRHAHAAPEAAPETHPRFPDEPQKGTTYYAVSRAMQMKFMRLPKSKVKIGQELPEHYR